MIAPTSSAVSTVHAASAGPAALAAGALAFAAGAASPPLLPPPPQPASTSTIAALRIRMSPPAERGFEEARPGVRLRDPAEVAVQPVEHFTYEGRPGRPYIVRHLEHDVPLD
jgi:hypothetical protein